MNSKIPKEVVIVDDQNLFAGGFKKILESIPGVCVISTFRNGLGLKQHLDILNPDVLFLDLNLPGKNGLEILQDIREKFPNMIIAVLTMYENNLLISRVKERKANAYLSKDASYDELKKVIFSSPEDPFYVSVSLDPDTNGRKDLQPDSFTDLALITNREKEIIKHIADGKNNHQISQALHISSETVKTHRKNIFRKLNLKKVPELIKFVYENNLY